MDLSTARQLFHYNPETGELRPLFVSKGRPAGMVYSPKTRTLHVEYVIYNTLHLRWFLYYGVWPTGEVDHRNRNDTDHRIVNLRDAGRQENSYNTTRANPNGMKGVSFCKDRATKPWLAQIRIDGRKVNLGRYPTAEEARDRYAAAALEHHGEFACLETRPNPLDARGDI